MIGFRVPASRSSPLLSLLVLFLAERTALVWLPSRSSAPLARVQKTSFFPVPVARLRQPPLLFLSCPLTASVTIGRAGQAR